MKRTLGRRFLLSPVIIGVIWLLVSVIFRFLATMGVTSLELEIIKNFINRGLGIFALLSIVLVIIGIIFLSTSTKKEKHFTIKEIIKYSRAASKKHMSKFLVGFGLYICLEILSYFLGYADQEGRLSLANLIVTLVVFVGTFRLGLGYKNLSLHIVHDVKSTFSDVFVGFKKSIRYLGAYILVVLIVIVGLLLLIVPGIIFGLKLWMVPYLILDKNVDPIKAIKMSWKMTKGYMGDIFVLNIVCGLINILGILVLLVGLFRTLPLLMIANAYLYKKIILAQSIKHKAQF